MLRLNLFAAVGDEFSVFAGHRQSMADLKLGETFERVMIFTDDVFELTELGMSFCKAVVAPFENP